MAQVQDEFHRGGDLLHQIADALGVSVSQIYEGQAPAVVADALDLIRHFALITDAQGRQRVMNVVQREAARCRSHDGSQP